MADREVQFERMLPHQMEAALAACATALVPLGTLEWHGVQNALGLDAIKAHALCVRAAQRGGGVVLPPVFGGVGGVDQPYTVVMEPEPTFHSRLLEPWLSVLCGELKRVGFRAIIVVTGHYGASQQMIVRETAVRETQRLAVPVLGTPEYWLALDAGYLGDHGGFFETSLLMALIPGLTDLSQLTGEPPFQGIGGGDARQATAEEGERISEVIVARLATLAQRMPQWDERTRTRFLHAEQALVSHQLEAGGTAGNVWAAWANIQHFAAYGELLADERFEAITELARTA
jgi:creatinine amidohydrolase